MAIATFSSESSSIEVPIHPAELFLAFLEKARSPRLLLRCIDGALQLVNALTLFIPPEDVDLHVLFAQELRQWVREQFARLKAEPSLVQSGEIVFVAPFDLQKWSVVQGIGMALETDSEACRAREHFAAAHVVNAFMRIPEMFEPAKVGTSEAYSAVYVRMFFIDLVAACVTHERDVARRERRPPRPEAVFLNQLCLHVRGIEQENDPITLL